MKHFTARERVFTRAESFERESIQCLSVAPFKTTPNGTRFPNRRKYGRLSAPYFLPFRNGGLAITQTIYDMIESIVTGESEDMASLQEAMVEEVNSMLPK